MNCFEHLDLGWSQGYGGSTLKFIDGKTVIYTCGCMMKFVDTTTGKEKSLKSGIHPFGAFALNTTSSVIAYAEKKLNPSIKVVSYPEFDVLGTLKDGCLMEYADISFSPTGPYVLTISSLPDFKLSLWNWETNTLLTSVTLKSHPGNTISFNPLNWKQICVTGDQSFHIGQIELSNDKYSINMKSIDLPSPNVALGTVASIDDIFHKTFSPSPILTAESVRVAPTLSPFHNKYKDKLKRVAPVSHSWALGNTLYIGCTDGQLINYDTNSSSLTVLTNPLVTVLSSSSSGSGIREEDEDEEGDWKPVLAQKILAKGDLEVMEYYQDGLFVCGSNGILRLLSLDAVAPDVLDQWDTKTEISTLAWSTAYDKILCGSPKGTVFSLFPSNKNADLNTMINVKFGPIVGADFVSPSNDQVISCRRNGVVQVWSVKNSEQLSSLKLNKEISTIACSPSSRCCFVGTSDGCLFVLDLNNPDAPRVIFEDNIHKGPITNIHFEPSGRLVFTGSNDGSVMICDTRASNKFRCLAHLDIKGLITGIGAFHQLKIEKDFCYIAISSENNGASSITHAKVPVDMSNKSDHAGFDDETFHLAPGFINRTDTVLPFSCSSISVIDAETCICVDSQSKKVVLLKVTKNGAVTVIDKCNGHQLKGGSVVVSPHCQWIGSCSVDGQLIFRTIDDFTKHVAVPCHSHFQGGASVIKFSNDGQQVVSAGNDGVVALWKWNYDGLSTADKSKVLGAVDASRGRYASLLGLRKEQDAVLQNMSPVSPGASISEKTWLEKVQKEVQDKKDLSYEPQIIELKKSIADLRATVLGMIDTNDNVDDIEQLRRHEFTLDLDERQRILNEGDNEIDLIKENAELENLAMLFLKELIKKECWDGMEVIGRALCLFQGELEVSNFPIKKETPEERKNITNVVELYKLETLEKEKTAELNAKDDAEDAEAEDPNKDSASVFGSHAKHYFSDSLQHSQFSLHSNQRKRDQIMLIRDTINQLKHNFNKEFNSVHSSKKAVITSVVERSERIKQILQDLKSDETVVMPHLSNIEEPEKFLVVEDIEIDVERYLTPEEEAAKVEALKIEAERKKLEEADNARERALDTMMFGKLEIRPEDELQKDLEKPEFMLLKTEDQWNEDEAKIAKEFEKKEKNLIEEREKYRKAMEAELKKLQTANQEGMVSFDDKLNKLFKLRIAYQKTVNQEELKIVRLARSIYKQEALDELEQDMSKPLDAFKTMKQKTQEDVAEIKRSIERLKEEHENIIQEDRAIEKQFKKDFSDVEAFVLDLLAKLYKRRPKITKQKVQQSEAIPLSANPFHVKIEDPDKIFLEAMAELDNEIHKPELVDDELWERFVEARMFKVESELTVKHHSQKIQDLNSYLLRKVDEDENVKNNIEKTFQSLNDLREKKLKFLMNLEVQLLLKQGQVEVDPGVFAVEFGDALLIHRSVCEDLNAQIVTLGEAKVTAMIDCKDYYKNIHILEWEHEKIQMEAEDINTKTRDVQLLRVTKELQQFLFEENNQQRMQKEIQTLEKTIKLNENMHKRKIADKKRILDRLSKLIRDKEGDCKSLDEELKELAVSLVERQQIQEATVSDMFPAVDQRMKDIVARRKLVDLAKSQSQEVAVLRAEVERLRMKTFPALVQNN